VLTAPYPITEVAAQSGRVYAAGAGLMVLDELPPPRVTPPPSPTPPAPVPSATDIPTATATATPSPSPSPPPHRIFLPRATRY